ncbi:hypothetical protein N7457_001457 [Penicillium paradoxum]|uniref:uncharacterized protein n=1 Tax=Penicillium paradoxum TaxID=176176 RepID=UPI0025498242|nr:uncharacterized protein N7457_001457 [Penicillium paradoxum]KAJ5794858.1 hypothetical protein N7457_001457 [Penicillium paradoxum]
MDPFKQLPAELIYEIIQYISDFVSLENLMAATPQVKDIFRANHHAILERTISSNSITSISDIRDLFRNIASIHCPSTHCSNLEEYMHLAHAESTPDSVLPNQTTTLDLSLQMLHIAAQIQRLACLCLSTMRRNFVTAVTSADTLFSPDQVRNTAEPFSWIEEYRVHWALWNLRHYSDLRKTVETQVPHDKSETPATNTWKWTAESLAKFDAYAVWNGISYYPLEQIWTVAAVLAELGLVTNSASGLSLAAWELPLETPMPFFASFELPRVVGEDLPLWRPPPIPIETPITLAWLLTASRRYLPSGQTALYRRLCLRSASRHVICNIQPYRQIGAFLWDKWRMNSVGLLPVSLAVNEVTPLPGGGFLDAEDYNMFHAQEARWLALSSLA